MVILCNVLVHTLSEAIMCIRPYQTLKGVICQGQAHFPEALAQFSQVACPYTDNVPTGTAGHMHACS